MAVKWGDSDPLICGPRVVRYLIPVVPPVVITDTPPQLRFVRLWFAYRSKPVANQLLRW
jgi:hypothetical protein